MTDVRLELPYPPPQLSPNARVHHMKKAKVVAEYREEVGWVALHDAGEELGFYGLRKPLTPPVRASVTFVVPDRRKRDLDNLLAMLKPAWDGLVDAGVLAGDDSERFSVTGVWIHPLDHSERFCIITHEPKVIVELRSL